MTFDAIVTAITDYANLTSAAAITRVGKSVNRHYRRITALLGMDATRFVTRNASTSIGVRTVTFTEIEKIDRLLDVTDSTAIRLIQEVSVHEIRSTQPGESQPMRWAVQTVDADDITVVLDTIPQAVYSLQADGWSTLTDLSGTQEPVFPESFHDILVWFVLAEELLKKEKSELSATYELKADKLLSDLRFQFADSHTRDTRQRGTSISTLTSGAAGGAGNQGGSAYTQTALITFDRGAGIVPFAVAQADAPYVPNLLAEGLGNITTDRLIGRDTAGTGESEQLTVGGGIEFTGSGGIQIANDGITYAKIQNVSAASKLLGRGDSGSGDPQELTVGAGLAISGTTLNVAVPDLPQGRLTLTSGTPVTASDVSGATTLYYTPHVGDRLWLYTGSAWVAYTFTELSLSLSGLTASKPYDIFLYDNSGTLTLEALVWTNTTTRATAITRQDGRYVKSGATTRLYLGTIYINASGGQTDDSAAKRSVWNYYHRVPRPLRVLEGTDTWTYTTATWRQVNAAAANQVDLVVGVADVSMEVVAVASFGHSVGGPAGATAIGYDSTSAVATGCLIGVSETMAANKNHFVAAFLRHLPAVGRHLYVWLEKVGTASGTMTWIGDAGVDYYQTGITGTLHGG